MLRECAYLSGMSCPEWERFKQLEIQRERFMKAAVNFICDGPKKHMPMRHKHPGTREEVCGCSMILGDREARD